MSDTAFDRQLAQQGAVLVEERVLRRIIKGDRKLRGIGLQVPHGSSYTLARDRLAAHVVATELPVELTSLPERVVLASADRGRPATPEAATHLWRSLFHASIHRAFDERLASRALTLAAVRERINRIGQTEFDEIRSVLKQEHLLLPPIDDIAMYVEFAALYLELKHFAPGALDRTFPALLDTAKVDATLAADIDVRAVLEATRPPGAPEVPVVVARAATAPVIESPRITTSDSDKRAALKAAIRAREKGNRARAAILHYKAGVERSAESDLGELAARLAKALGAPAEASAGWAAALAPVAAHAALATSQRFSAAARLLFDLQAACVISDREVKVVDFFGWAFSRGKRALVRPLPATREVRVARRLRSAVERIPTSGVPSQALTAALSAIAERADINVRDAVRPKIEAALDQVELHPHSLPERVGEKKLVDEMLDRAVEVGRLSLGNLRDGISKNDLKIGDLTRDEFRHGDALLRADKILATSLDGVYRRGESYMRGLQKFSSLWFGTKLGRLLTLYAALPFLGAIAVVDGAQHMVGPLMKWITGTHPEINTWPNRMVGTGALFCLIHIGFVRRAATWVALKLWRLIKLIVWDWPRLVWRHPLATRLFESVVIRWLVRPAIPALIIWLAVPADRFVGPLPLRWTLAIGIGVVLAVVSNIRFGQLLEERMIDWGVRSSRHITTRMIPGMVRWLLDLFRRFVEWIERGIYRVDEYLRFKSGQSRITLVIKGTLGTLWFIVTYLLRLFINLFFEPTVNPIKHFPVVTVAAKLIIPVIPSMAEAITNATTPLLGAALAGGFAGFSVIMLPGLAGFLVWEFKENWKLYRASRAKIVKPISIGHHGETMVGFVKPGFHSGTIPKLFTKLRRAAWKDDEAAVTKHRHGLHHVEEAIDKFADRQLVSMLNEVSSFTATDVAVAGVEVGSNRVHIELVCPSVGPTAATIRFELQSGWLVASLPEKGWIAQLDAHHRTIFEIALTGFYKLSGVELVREQIEDAVAGSGSGLAYDIADEGLLVWPGGSYDLELVFDLRSRRVPVKVRGGNFEGAMPDLLAKHALFTREPLYWSVWTTAWQQIARGDPPSPLLTGPSLLGRAAA